MSHIFANAISTTDYKSIMTEYAAAKNQLTGISDNYFEAAYTVLITNVFNPEIDLLVAFHNAYIISQSAYASVPSSAINAIGALQSHILRKSVSGAGLQYDDINDYYEDNSDAFPTGENAVIPQAFADISSQAGHTVESTYITP